MDEKDMVHSFEESVDEELNELDEGRVETVAMKAAEEAYEEAVHGERGPPPNSSNYVLHPEKLRNSGSFKHFYYEAKDEQEGDEGSLESYEDISVVPMDSASIQQQTEVEVILPLLHNLDLDNYLKEGQDGFAVSLPTDLTTDDLFFELRRAVSVLVGATLLQVDLELHGKVVNLGIDGSASQHGRSV